MIHSSVSQQFVRFTSTNLSELNADNASAQSQARYVIGHSSPSRRARVSRQSRTCRLIDCTLRSRPNIPIRSSTFTVLCRPHHLHSNVSDFTGS